MADAVAGYIRGLLDGVQFKRSSYAVDRACRDAPTVSAGDAASRPAELLAA
jgi:hypothetical protein